MQGIPGIAIANVVSNPESASLIGKKLRTKITKNDGKTWSYLQMCGESGVNKR